MAPPDDEDFAALLAEYDEKQPKGKKAGKGPAIGDMVKARIVSGGAGAVFVDLGGKAEGMIEIDQVVDKDGVVTVKVGDTIEARVVDTGAKTGFVVLRRHMSRGAEAKSELVQAFEHRIPVEGLVTAAIK